MISSIIVDRASIMYSKYCAGTSTVRSILKTVGVLPVAKFNCCKNKESFVEKKVGVVEIFITVSFLPIVFAVLGYAAIGIVEGEVWWSRDQELPADESFPTSEMAGLAFVEDDHVLVFVLKCYLGRWLALEPDTEGRREDAEIFINGLTSGLVTPELHHCVTGIATPKEKWGIRMVYPSGEMAIALSSVRDWPIAPRFQVVPAYLRLQHQILSRRDGMKIGKLMLRVYFSGGICEL
ncbi:hypothetical protein L873DRAFT_1089986 [Choiromyces venosus 120613-1]|uniref:Uncharacterized protein n=1 Tax=Choiromyces venosus 120613-1 TaxID=1336337 RepID=A0A3N4JLF7_9PEZI|nr:hypothetical protein L873DRAFT_1089986 [Choiromyces venosus 120613-1]